jgi:hypothetical protein
MNVDHFQVARWIAVAEDRFQARIPPTDDDQKWFQRNKRSRNGWARLYRVRPALASDHWLFDFKLAKPEGYITIVRNYEFWRAVIAIETEKFGPIVNSDEYARMRLMRIPDIDLRSDPQLVSQ